MTARDLAGLARGPVRAASFGGCAIIASRDALFGMARMFEVFAENYFGAMTP